MVSIKHQKANVKQQLRLKLEAATKRQISIAEQREWLEKEAQTILTLLESLKRQKRTA